MAAISPLASQAQRTPTRVFLLDPVKSVDDFRFTRDLAYGLVVGKIQATGALPADFDVRAASPADDFAGMTSVTNNYNGDWSIGSATVGGTTDGKITGAGNTALTGTMLANRFLTLYGTSVQTAGAPPEVAWVFKSSNNIKTIWMLQELLGYENPRAVTRVAPLWGPTDPVTHSIISVASAPAQDVHYSLWGEPIGITITASNVRA